MSRRTVLLLVAGLIAAFTAVSVRNRMSQNTAPPPVAVQQSTRVIVAKHDLSPGSFVQGGQDLDWGEAPQTPPKKEGEAKEGDAETPSYLSEGSFKLTDFNGAVVRKAIRAGEAVPQSALMRSGEGGFMSAVLEPGMRAVSIAVNATSGNAGFVSPGDHVDLIVTHRVHMNGSDQESVLSETFIYNVRIVAVDQMLDNPENKAILAKTVTVEVSPKQAEQVAVAAELGKISVALRSLTNEKQPQQAEPSTATIVPPLPPVAGAPMESPIAVVENAVAEAPLTVNGTPVTTDQDVLKKIKEHDASVVSPRVQILRGDQVQSVEFYQR